MVYLAELTDEEFRHEVTSRLPSLLLKLRPSSYLPEPVEVGEDVEVCCAMCVAHLGYLKDVRIYQKSHHLVFDSSVSDRVRVKTKYSCFRDGRCACILLVPLFNIESPGYLNLTHYNLFVQPFP